MATSDSLSKETTGSEARGYWIKHFGHHEIVWQINGEFITDRELRRFIYHNNPDSGPHDRYVGLCIVQWHVDQWAKSRADLGVTSTSSRGEDRSHEGK